MALIQMLTKIWLHARSRLLGNEAPFLVGTFIARGVAAAGSLVLLVVLGRLYGVAGTGVFVLAQSIIMAVSTIARYGMNNALVRFVGREYLSSSAMVYLRWACIRALIYSLVLGASIYLCRGFFEEAFGIKDLALVLATVVIALPAITLAMLLSGFLKGVRKPAAACLLENGAVPLVAAVLLSILAWVRPETSVAGAGVAFSVAAWLVLTYGLWLVREWDRQTDNTFRDDSTAAFDSIEFSRSSREFFIISLTTMMQTVGIVIVAGFFLSSGELGLFRSAQQLALLVSFVLFVINAVYPPRFAALFYQDRTQELERLAQRSALLGLVLSLPVALLCLITPTVVLSLFGSGFDKAAVLLQIIVVAQIINVGTGPVVLLLGMTGYESLMRSISLVCTITGLLLFCTLTPIFGSIGAAWALAILLVMQKVVTVAYAWRSLGVWSVPGPNILKVLGLHSKYK